jgi:hypothetical protein
VQVPGETIRLGWENAHRDSTSKNKAIRLMHRQIVQIAEMQAMLDNTSVYEIEGREALKILEKTPCLAGLRTRY